MQVTCLQFSGSRIVSGSDDNTLRVWNAITGRVITLSQCVFVCVRLVKHISFECECSVLPDVTIMTLL